MSLHEECGVFFFLQRPGTGGGSVFPRNTVPVSQRDHGRGACALRYDGEYQPE